MITYGEVTKKLNDIIASRGINNTDDFYTKIVRDFISSKDRQKMIKAEAYYNYNHDIEYKKRLVISGKNEVSHDPNLPNSRYTLNIYADMVDQKVNYLLGKPILFKADDEKVQRGLNKFLGSKFHKLIKNLGKDVYNCGIGYVYVYYDENGEFRLKRFKPYEILPIWKDDDREALESVIRVYDTHSFVGRQDKTETRVDIYTLEGITHYKLTSTGIKREGESPYFIREGRHYKWDRLPIIPFKSSESGIPLLYKCKSLQDGLNKIVSMFDDVMAENSSGSSILVLKNFFGENLGEFRRNLAQYRAIKVGSVDGMDGDVSKLDIEVNSTNFETLIKLFKQGIIRQCSGYDIEELKSSGSPNEMTIKSIFNSIDIDANELETEFRGSLYDLLWFISVHMKGIGDSGFEDGNIEIIFNRDMLINESEIIKDIASSQGLLSRKTLLSMHPYVTDVEAEIKELEKEKSEALNSYGGFGLDEEE